MEGDRNYWDNWMRRRMSRRSMLQRAGIAGLVLAGGSSLVACGQSTTQQSSTPAAGKSSGPKRGGTLKVGVSKQEQPSGLDPHVRTGGTSVSSAIMDQLVGYNDKLEYLPARSLAESWETPDSTTLIFKLRKGVKFQDGTDFDADAVKFNFERIANPDTKSNMAYVVNSFKSVDYVDKYTVKIVLKEAAASILGDLAEPDMAMVSPAAVKKYSKEDLQIKILGTGAFQMTEYVTDDHFLMVANKDHWQKDENGQQLPFLDQIRMVPIPDATVRSTNLRTGVIDVDGLVEAKDVAKIQGDPNLKTIIQPGVSMPGITWNLSRGPMVNLNFRRAVTWAINREAIVKAVSFGTGVPGVSTIYPAHEWAFDAKLDVPKYDPVKAKQYLDRAVAEGVKPEWTCYTLAGDIARAVEMAQADLAKIGIKMNIIPDTQAPSRFWTSFEIDSFSASYGVTTDPYGKFFTLSHSKGRYTPEKGSVGPGWDTPEKLYSRIDPLIEKSNQTYDLKKRKEYMDQAAKIIADEVGFVVLYYSSSIMGANKKVEGISWAGHDDPHFERGWINS